MGVYLLVFLSIFSFLYILNRMVVTEFKNSYYKTMLELRGIESSVEDVNTILDIINK